MRVRILRFLSVVMLCGLMLPGMIAAQSDDAARETVLAAVEDTVTLEGYHVVMKSNYLNTITQQDGFITQTYTIQTLEGDVASNGDVHYLRQTYTGDTLANAMQTEAFVVEQIISDGENYLNLQMEGTIYADMLEVEPGWWHYETLLDSLNGSIAATVIQQYGREDTPLKRIINADTVVAVEELEPQVVGGLDMRVFAVELDAVRLLLEQSAASEADMEAVLAESQDLLEASDIRLNYQLWIGAEDGLVYRGKGEQVTNILYASAGSDNDPDFDVTGGGNIEFNLSQHGEAVTIRPPDADSLNE